MSLDNILTYLTAALLERQVPRLLHDRMVVGGGKVGGLGGPYGAHPLYAFATGAQQGPTAAHT